MVKRYVGAGAALLLVVVGVAKIARRSKSEPSAVALASASAEASGSVHAERPHGGKVSSGPPSMIHLDPHHTNRSAFAGPTSPTVAWTYDTGGPIEAAPAVLEDGTILVASLGGKLHAVSDKGEARFSADLGDRVYGSPLVHPDGIFLGSDAHKFFGMGKDGAIHFRLDTEGDVDTGAAPAPWGGIVFASGKMVYASKPDGTLLWRTRARRKVYGSPAVGDDGTVFFGSQDHFFYAVSPDGKIKWKVDMKADVDASAAIQDDGTIVVGSDAGEVAALAPEDGQMRWRTAVGGYVRGAISLGRDGSIFAGTYGPTPHMVALEPEDGRIRFRYAVAGTGSPEFGIHGGPVEDASGRLYFGAQDDHVYCLAPDGSLIWKFKTGGDVDAPLVIAPNGALLVGSDDGKLYALKSP